MRGGRDRLGRRVIEALVSRRIDPERSESGNVDEAKRALGAHGQSVNFVLESALPNWFQHEPVSDLRQNARLFEAGV